MTLLLRTSFIVRLADDEACMGEVADMLDMAATWLEDLAKREGVFTQDATMGLVEPMGFRHETDLRTYEVLCRLERMGYGDSIFGSRSVGRLPPK